MTDNRHSVIPPLKTEDQARRLPAVAAIYAAARESPRRGVMAEESLKFLLGALHDGGVAMGGYDGQIAGWLSQWEPQVVAAVAGWVLRAHEAGLAAAETGEDDDG